MDMKLRQLAGTIFIIIIVGMIIYLVGMPKASEGFVDANRCGVYMPPCEGEHIRCMNGYCKSDIPRMLPPMSDLPMLPPTKYPYA